MSQERYEPSGSCIELTNSVTRITSTPEFRAHVLRAADPPAAALAAMRDRLAGEDRETWETQFGALPPYILNVVAEAMVDAAAEELPFSFENKIPETPIAMARSRGVEITLRLEEEQLKVTMSHTLRHPTWMPSADSQPEVAAVS